MSNQPQYTIVQDNPVVRLLGAIVWALLALCALTTAASAVQWFGRDLGSIVALGGVVAGGVCGLVAIIKLLTKS
jgi:hypothetical protein